MASQIDEMHFPLFSGGLYATYIANAHFLKEVMYNSNYSSFI